MSESFYALENLSTREGFNRALSHFQSMSGIIDEFESFTNLADIINEMLESKEMEQHQVLPAVYALLNDKYDYACISLNLKKNIDTFDSLFENVRTWKAVDILLLYHHPDLGPVVFNPKNKKHIESLNLLKSNELLTVYAGTFSVEDKNNVRRKALNILEKYFYGKKISSSDFLKKGKFTAAKKEREKKSLPAKKKTVKKKEEKPAVKASSPEKSVSAAPASGAGRMTPFYSIPVTNELFHNGNVEAWKKIIQSYNARHPDLEVFIYYDGERIHDIHSLFKWGKVKHGSTILFAVKGENIKDVAKLQRYLRQGASPMFEAFLKFPVNKVLNLF